MPQGYTLIELVACLVIVAVLGAIAAPRFVDTQPFEERGYADELGAALRYGQHRAVASGCEVEVTISAASYQAMQRAAAGGTCSPAGAWTVPVPLTDGTTLSGTAPANVTASPTPQQIIFDSQGRVSSAPLTPLAIGSATVSVVTGSGLVTVR